MPDNHPTPRRLLLDLYAAGLAAVDGAALTRRALQGRQFPQPLHLVAIGKAAGAMARGASAALAAQLASALIITRHGHAHDIPADPRFTVLTASHPLPDAASLAAGTMLVQLLRAAPRGQFLFLLSGGASSVCELPAANLALEDLQRATRWLLGSGLPIAAVNAVRGRLSLIKNGGLLAYVQAQHIEVLLLSDVPDDNPAVLGSGPLFPASHALPDNLPDWLGALLPPLPVVEAALSSVAHTVIGSNADCLRAMADAAQARGWLVHLHNTALHGPAEVAGVQLAGFLQDAPPGIHLWGGETTVVLPAQAGRGGRSQQLALCAACELAGRDDCILLAAGTDGSDGNSDDAGALIDGGTVTRGRDAGLDEKTCLVHADAGSFLAASGDLLHTGPTGTNVMDVVIALKDEL